MCYGIGSFAEVKRSRYQLAFLLLLNELLKPAHAFVSDPVLSDDERSLLNHRGVRVGDNDVRTASYFRALMYTLHRRRATRRRRSLCSSCHTAAGGFTAISSARTGAHTSCGTSCSSATASTTLCSGAPILLPGECTHPYTQIATISEDCTIHASRSHIRLRGTAAKRYRYHSNAHLLQ